MWWDGGASQWFWHGSSRTQSVHTRRGVIKRPLLYLGEINDAQRAQWCSALDVLDESNNSVQQMTIFPEDRTPPPEISHPIQFRLNRQKLRRARQGEGTYLLRTHLTGDMNQSCSRPDAANGCL